MSWMGPSLSDGFHYRVMPAVLLIRSYGLFGNREVRRI